VTPEERRRRLEAIASEVSTCTRCPLSVGRTNAVPGEGSAETEVVFVGEGPGFNEDQQGRPFVGAAGTLLNSLIRAIGWRREDVFITNVSSAARRAIAILSPLRSRPARHICGASWRCSIRPW